MYIQYDILLYKACFISLGPCEILGGTWMFHYAGPGKIQVTDRIQNFSYLANIFMQSDVHFWEGGAS